MVRISKTYIPKEKKVISRISAVFFIPLWGVLFLGETISSSAILGILMVFLGLIFIFSCSNDNSENQPIGQANPELGIENIIPSNLGKEYSANFNRYTKVVTPNGGKIHIVAQSNLTDEQIV